MQKYIPESKERLSEIGLDAMSLMMNIVVIDIVAETDGEWVPREGITTMITNYENASISITQNSI